MKLLNFKNLDELTNEIKTEKSCIIGLVNRNTKQVKAYKVSSNEKGNLLPKIYLNCKDKSNIFTDSYNGYDDLKKNITIMSLIICLIKLRKSDCLLFLICFKYIIALIGFSILTFISIHLYYLR